MEELQLRYVLGQDVRLDLGLALVLFAPTWWLASRALVQARQALRWLAAFNLLLSLALLGVGLLPPATGGWAQLLLAQLQLLAWIALWRAGAGLSHAADAWPEQLGLALLSTLVMVAALLRGASSEQLLAMACVAQAMALGRGASQVGRRLAALARPGAARVVRLGSGLMALLLLLRAAGAWWLGADIDRVYKVSLVLGYLAMPTAFGVNVLLAYHQFGGLLRAADHLRARVAPPRPRGLDAVEAVLVSEGAELLAQGRRLVLVAVAAEPGWPGRHGWSPLQRARFDAELTRSLRQQLADTDLLGQADDRVVLIGLVDRPPAMVPAAVQALLGAAQGAVGDALVGIGQVDVMPGDDLASTLAVARARCRADLPAPMPGDRPLAWP